MEISRDFYLDKLIKRKHNGLINKGWQHGGVREIMCLFLPKKEIAFVE